MHLRSPAAILLLALAGLSSAAQQDTSVFLTPGSNNRSTVGRPGVDLPPAFPPGTMEKLARTRQTERQKRIIADTDHLLALANQLKSDLGKSPAQPAPPADQLKKAEEIEKLAHSVKERMKG